MRKIISTIALLSLLAYLGLALEIYPSMASAQIATPAPVDPCFGNGLKSSAVINIASATTTELVAAVAGKTVYVCHVDASAAGTTPSIQFKTGTRVTNPCDTGAVNLTGTYLITAGNQLDLAWGGMLMASSSGGEICATSAGTGPSFQGIITYVQQ